MSRRRTEITSEINSQGLGTNVSEKLKTAMDGKVTEADVSTRINIQSSLPSNATLNPLSAPKTIETTDSLHSKPSPMDTDSSLCTVMTKTLHRNEVIVNKDFSSMDLETSLSKQTEEEVELSNINVMDQDSNISTDKISPTDEIENPELVERADAIATEKSGCYCSKDRNLNSIELQCSACFKWFHQECVTVIIGKCVSFLTNYTFMCKICNATGIESFVKKQSNFTQICLSAIANLAQKSVAEGNPKTLFSRDKEIIPYVDKHWESLSTMQRRIKQTWHTTIHKTMLKEVDIFTSKESPIPNKSGEIEQLFGLTIQDLQKIGPGFETQLRQSVKTSDFMFGFGKGRGAKRKVTQDAATTSSTKKPKSDLTMPKLPPHGYPLEHPFNKDGYRYILAEPDPHAPFRQEFDESSDWAGKPIPGWLYRTLVPNNVLLAMHDRAPQLKVSDDRLSVIGEKGYCMIRATHGVNRGTWYYECTIEEMSEGAAARLGWSQSLGNLQAPLGYDKFGYSWRSRKGTKFHQSRGKHYSDSGYNQGDVLGFLIHLPFDDYTIPLPQTYKDKPLVKFKSYLYFEEKDEVQLTLKSLRELNGSKIIFYKNGVNMGTAFDNIFGGTYFPALSLYKNCTVALNCGPNFKHPPKDIRFKGMFEAGHEALVEQTTTDLIFFAENEGKLRLDTF